MSVTIEDIQNAARVHFDLIDVNKNGSLDIDEVR